MNLDEKLTRELEKQRKLEERDEAYAKSLIEDYLEDEFEGFSAKDYQDYVKSKKYQ